MSEKDESKWHIPEYCTFRTEEDGKGYAFNADSDSLHPLNTTAVAVLQRLTEGGATEEEVFDEIWPKVESSVRECVRGDIKEFLAAMAQRGCVSGDGKDAGKKDGAKKSPMQTYAPPQVDDFGRAGLTKPIRSQARAEGGGACTDGSTPSSGSARQANEGKGERPPQGDPKSDARDEADRDSNCAPDGNQPTPGYYCEDAGNKPSGSGGYCHDGSDPVSDTCIEGSGPDAGICEYGRSPDNEICQSGLTPATGYYCANGATPSGTSPSSYCQNGTDPAYEHCKQGQSPNGNAEEGYCHDAGVSPQYADCYGGSGPTGVGISCDSGDHPSPCDPTGNNPDIGGWSGGGWQCATGTDPDDANCSNGAGPSWQGHDCEPSGNIPGNPPGWLCTAGTHPG
ncbi:MAG: hypothetical protein ABIH23_14160 [bacterium]